MKPGATDDMVRKMAERVEQMGLKAHVIHGTERTVIAAVGEKRNGEKETLESYPEVEKVVPILAPYKVASREAKPESTVVRVRDLALGDGHVGVIAGPCSVESEEQIMESARQVQAAGARGLRGGAFKPRTSPYSFQGLGAEGLVTLRRVREEIGLPVVSEVIDTASADLVADHVDLLQIGARNMQNFSLLKKVAEIDRPILLKRGIAASFEEWLMAAEYLLSGGNSQVILCERGIRTFSNHARNTLDLNVVPLARKVSHLPVVVDPSHGVGDRDRVRAMARAALASGAQGLLIETHTAPATSYSDADQTIDLSTFAGVVRDAEVIARLEGLAG
jgi:3-deoxy-7-phosphoheptulonate synthase